MGACAMKGEHEREENRITAARLRLTEGSCELRETNEEMGALVLVNKGSCTFTSGEQSFLINPGNVLLLAQAGVFDQVGHTVPELLVCSFPLNVLREIRAAAQRDYARLFESDEITVLFGPAQWTGRLRALLDMLCHAADEAECPGVLYLMLILHYIEQECIAESSAVVREHNETAEKICAYLAANYQQRFSLTEVAARFYLSPYYLSRLFRRVTGQSIVDYLNNRRIEAGQKLLEQTELSISDVAEQIGFASAAHFRRVFRETMGLSPMQYRKEHKN